VSRTTNRYWVVEGSHDNPNDINTLDQSSKREHGPYTEQQATEKAKSLIQRNIDDFYHRAWVISK